MEHNGVTLERRLTTDRLLWKTGEIEMGPKYYAARRLEYQDMSSVATKLVPTLAMRRMRGSLRCCLA